MSVIDLFTGETIEPQSDLDYVKEALDDYHTLVISSEQVVEVVRFALAERPGRDEVTDMAAVVRLTDGKFAAMEGACDYTGYSCQAYLDVTVHDTADEAWLNGITRDGRAMVERSES